MKSNNDEEISGEEVTVLTETERVATITKEIESAVMAQMENGHDNVAMEAEEYTVGQSGI